MQRVENLNQTLRIIHELAVEAQNVRCLTDRKEGLPDQHIGAELVERVRERIGPVAAFKRACVVERLPKTRSGKILRGTMRKIADGEPWSTPPTIDDPAILGEVQSALARLGYER